nr:FAD-dependent oxidoreductase [Brevibacterium celere]
MKTHTHQILVLGAGYSGLTAAQRLARQLPPRDYTVTVVTREPEFIERPRLHQVATGQPVPRFTLADHLRPHGVNLRLGNVVGVDWHNSTVDLVQGASLAFDTLVVALGSETSSTAVDGVAEHAVLLDDRSAAEAVSIRMKELARTRGEVVVCGGGLTGVEIATETAEQWPGITVTLVSAGEVGGSLAPRGRRYLDRILDQLGVLQVKGRVAEVTADEVRLTTGEALHADLCHWAGGFRPSPLIASMGLAADGRGRALVDETLRSISHHQVWVIGDAAAVPGPWGLSLAMGCRTGGFTGPAAADAIAAELTGRSVRPFRFRYVHECLSLGRQNGVVQFLDARGRPKNAVLTGRPAIAYKDMTLNGARWLFRHPGPYLVRRPTHPLSGRESVGPRRTGS